MSLRLGLVSLVVAVLAAATCPSAYASTIWTGNPSQGDSVFYIVDCAAPGTLTTVHDATMGSVWRYSKPAGDKRCETRGVAVNGAKYNVQNNSTYYFGWWSKLTSTVDDYANFQWKSYGTGMTQNYPFVIKLVNGRTSVWQFQPGSPGQQVWASNPISANTWYHYVVGVHTSDTLTGGWIQLWFDGVAQKFTDGSTQYHCRTWDTGNDNEPKWGVYGATATAFTNYVSPQKLGTSYADVAS